MAMPLSSRGTEPLKPLRGRHRAQGTYEASKREEPSELVVRT